MSKLLKKFGVALTLLATCFCMAACGGDDDEMTMTEKVRGTWTITYMEFVEIDEKGYETVTTNDRMMQSQEWTFGTDGVQYIVNDGYPAQDKYTYSISGKHILFIPIDNTELEKIEADIIAIDGKTMRMNYYAYGDKKDFIRYTFTSNK